MPGEQARRARDLVEAARAGVLCTNSSGKPGYPFGSAAPYTVDGKGRPIFLLSSMAVHTDNLRADGRASLFVAAEPGADGPLAAARINLFGRVAPLQGPEASEARRLYVEAHPEAEAWADFGDFAFYRLEPDGAYLIGGFGAMSWIEAKSMHPM